MSLYLKVRHHFWIALFRIKSRTQCVSIVSRFIFLNFKTLYSCGTWGRERENIQGNQGEVFKTQQLLQVGPRGGKDWGRLFLRGKFRGAKTEPKAVPCPKDQDVARRGSQPNQQPTAGEVQEIQGVLWEVLPNRVGQHRQGYPTHQERPEAVLAQTRYAEDQQRSKGLRRKRCQWRNNDLSDDWELTVVNTMDYSCLLL